MPLSVGNVVSSNNTIGTFYQMDPVFAAVLDGISGNNTPPHIFCSDSGMAGVLNHISDDAGVVYIGPIRAVSIDQDPVSDAGIRNIFDDVICNHNLSNMTGIRACPRPYFIPESDVFKGVVGAPPPTPLICPDPLARQAADMVRDAPDVSVINARRCAAAPDPPVTTLKPAPLDQDAIAGRIV